MRRRFDCLGLYAVMPIVEAIGGFACRLDGSLFVPGILL